MTLDMMACADWLDNLRHIAKAVGEISNQVWKRGKKGRNGQEWNYRAMEGCLRRSRVGARSPLKEQRNPQLV